MYRHILLLIITLATVCGTWAQTTTQPRDSVRVIGRVADLLTNQAIPDVFCEVLWASDSTVVDTLHTVMGDSNNRPTSFAIFHIKRPGRYILRMQKDGYEQTEQAFEVKRFYRDEETVDLIDKPF